VLLRLRSDADIDLEEWAGERAAEVFQQVYKRPLTLGRSRQ